MLDTLKKNVLLPLVGRLGTMIAGVLVPYGINADYAHMLAIGIIGVALIGVDLVASYLNRRFGS